ncbi:hypothetical protein [Archaeoglobus veneficus]|uniref:Uncharacterized protein n=1 Tax=Archaeoglobus veneficus (strain DSM 11195 / SNP6) TaxID=693661 RepID=F2KQY4_ARCVS|nr:hypothetical protein [Archaeoglobus veneficus]AEA47790.1 hypothetical protein Arcve_1794 [Archaeoglobus veneficus SNP6]
MLLKLDEVRAGSVEISFNLTEYGEVIALISGNEDGWSEEEHSEEIDRLKKKYRRLKHRLKLWLRLLCVALRHRRTVVSIFSSITTFRMTTRGKHTIQTIVELDGDVITKVPHDVDRRLMDIHSKNVELAMFIWFENVKILIRLLCLLRFRPVSILTRLLLKIASHIL